MKSKVLLHAAWVAMLAGSMSLSGCGSRNTKEMQQLKDRVDSLTTEMTDYQTKMKENLDNIDRLTANMTKMEKMLTSAGAGGNAAVLQGMDARIKALETAKPAGGAVAPAGETALPGLKPGGGKVKTPVNAAVSAEPIPASAPRVGATGLPKPSAGGAASPIKPLTTTKGKPPKGGRPKASAPVAGGSEAAGTEKPKSSGGSTAASPSTGGYKVPQAGDTFETFAARYGATAEKIRAANNNPTTIVPGQRYWVPGAKGTAE